MSDEKVRDHIFPLIKAKKQKKGEIQVGELIGTGFLIGESGFSLTASHVIDQLLEGNREDDILLALFIVDDYWLGVEVDLYEKHRTEDVGILKFKTFKRKSILKINDKPQHQSCEYHCWGYPKEVAQELSKLDQNAPIRPDLIFTQGYIRRRIQGPLYPTIIFKGEQFYELSETVGSGNSGGPLILKKTIGQPFWEIFGIYIGEKSEGNIGYGVRAEAFATWIPKILGKTVLEEANGLI